MYDPSYLKDKIMEGPIRVHLTHPSSRIRVAKADTTAPHPHGWGSIWNIESQANNWKPDRFAGANGVLYTRCTKLTETIMQRCREGPFSIQDFAQVLLSLTSTGVLSGSVIPKGPSLVLQHLMSSGQEWEQFTRKSLKYLQKSQGTVSFIHF